MGGVRGLRVDLFREDASLSFLLVADRRRLFDLVAFSEFEDITLLINKIDFLIGRINQRTFNLADIKRQQADESLFHRISSGQIWALECCSLAKSCRHDIFRGY